MASFSSLPFKARLYKVFNRKRQSRSSMPSSLVWWRPHWPRLTWRLSPVWQRSRPSTFISTTRTWFMVCWPRCVALKKRNRRLPLQTTVSLRVFVMLVAVSVPILERWVSSGRVPLWTRSPVAPILVGEEKVVWWWITSSPTRRWTTRLRFLCSWRESSTVR